MFDTTVQRTARPAGARDGRFARRARAPPVRGEGSAHLDSNPEVVRSSHLRPETQRTAGRLPGGAMDQELHHELRPKRSTATATRPRRCCAPTTRATATGPRGARRPRAVRARRRAARRRAEHGHRSWPAFKRAARGAGRRASGRSTGSARSGTRSTSGGPTACSRPPARGDRDALARLRRRVPRLATTTPSVARRTADARVCLAHEYGFRTWDGARRGDRPRPRHALQRAAAPSCRGSRPRRRSAPATPSGCARCSSSTPASSTRTPA